MGGYWRRRCALGVCWSLSLIEVNFSPYMCARKPTNITSIVFWSKNIGQKRMFRGQIWNSCLPVLASHSMGLGTTKKRSLFLSTYHAVCLHVRFSTHPPTPTHKHKSIHTRTNTNTRNEHTHERTYTHKHTHAQTHNAHTYNRTHIQTYTNAIHLRTGAYTHMRTGAHIHTRAHAQNTRAQVHIHKTRTHKTCT